MDNDLELGVLLSQTLDVAYNKKNKDHEIKIIPRLPCVFYLRHGEFFINYIIISETRSWE